MNGYDLRDAIADVDDVELAEFTRDGYKTMWLLAHTRRAKHRVIDLADQADFTVTVDGELDENTAAYRLTLKCPRKVQKGGNRL